VYEGASNTSLYSDTTDTMGQVVFRMIKTRDTGLYSRAGILGMTLQFMVFAKEDNVFSQDIDRIPNRGR